MVIHLWNWDRKRRLIRFTSYTVTFGQYLMYPSLFIWRAYLDCVIWLVIHLTSQITQSKYANMWWFFFLWKFLVYLIMTNKYCRLMRKRIVDFGFLFSLATTISNSVNILDYLSFYSYSWQSPILLIFSTTSNCIHILDYFQYHFVADQFLSILLLLWLRLLMFFFFVAHFESPTKQWKVIINRIFNNALGHNIASPGQIIYSSRIGSIFQIQCTLYTLHTLTSHNSHANNAPMTIWWQKISE